MVEGPPVLRESDRWAPRASVDILEKREKQTENYAASSLTTMLTAVLAGLFWVLQGSNPS